MIKKFENFSNSSDIDKLYEISISHLKDKFKNIKIVKKDNLSSIIFTIYEDRKFMYNLISKELYQFENSIKIIYNKKVEPDKIYEAIKESDVLDWIIEPLDFEK